MRSGGEEVVSGERMESSWEGSVWHGKSRAHLSVAGKIDLEGFGVVLEAERRHGKENILSIDRLPLLLLTFLGSCGRR